jgi:hypothetical protein
MSPLTIALFVFGYPTSIAIIVRWTAVVREQRVRWFALHHSAVLAIIIGWIIEGRASAVAINSLWLLSATVWYLRGGRR